MQKKNYKGRCIKKKSKKSNEVCKVYSDLAEKYLELLEASEDIKEIRTNVLLEGINEGDYTSDFVCVKADDDILVRECVQRKFLTKPMTLRQLDLSRSFWLSHGIKDWGIVIEEEGCND